MQGTNVQITKKFNIIIWQVHNYGADKNSDNRVMHRSLEMQDSILQFINRHIKFHLCMSKTNVSDYDMRVFCHQ